MALQDMPIFAMLRSRLSYLSERQRMIAQNVANADTPGYTPSDLRPFTIAQGSRMASPLAPVMPAQTAAMHLAGTLPRTRNSPFRSAETPDSETTMDGNSVVLDEEMMRLTQARMDYDAAIGFYQKSLGLIRMATRRPGGG